jgi:hypothetical protein
LTLAAYVVKAVLIALERAKGRVLLAVFGEQEIWRALASGLYSRSIAELVQALLMSSGDEAETHLQHRVALLEAVVR